MLLFMLLSISIHVFGAANQGLKDPSTQQLYEAVVMIVPDNQMHIKCQAITNALKSGADVKAVQMKLSPMHDVLMEAVVRSQDKTLLTQLLECGADIRVKWKGLPILVLAEQRSMAKLLFEHGAHTDLNDQQKYDVFSSIMHDDRDPKLIDVYKKYTFNAMIRCNRSGWTLLMKLATSPGSTMIKKAKLLLNDLGPDQIKYLIEAKSNLRHSVFDIINIQKTLCKNKKSNRSLKDCTYLEAYHQLLSKKVALACSICLDDCFKSESITTLCCKQQLHASCLTQWIYLDEKKNLCPLCRNGKPV